MYNENFESDRGKAMGFDFKKGFKMCIRDSLKGSFLFCPRHGKHEQQQPGAEYKDQLFLIHPPDRSGSVLLPLHNTLLSLSLIHIFSYGFSAGLLDTGKKPPPAISADSGLYVYSLLVFLQAYAGDLDVHIQNDEPRHMFNGALYLILDHLAYLGDAVPIRCV